MKQETSERSADNELRKDNVFVEDVIDREEDPDNHPLSCIVKNTREAQDMYDSFSYDKGAAVLTQLVYLIGEGTFRTGLHNYLQLYQWDNATTLDFLDAMKVAATAAGLNVDLDRWCIEYLQSTGYNIFTPVYEITAGRISRFEVHQSCSPIGDEILRTHLLAIALYDESCKETIIEPIRIRSEAVTPVAELIGLPEPAAVLLNAFNYAYAKVTIDAKSSAFFRTAAFKGDERNYDIISDILDLN